MKVANQSQTAQHAQKLHLNDIACSLFANWEDVNITLFWITLHYQYSSFKA